MNLSRRTLLAATSAGAIGMSVASRPAAAAAGTAAAASITTSAATLTTFSADFGQRFVNPFPRAAVVNVPIGQGAAPATLVFDAKGLAWDGTPVVASIRSRTHTVATSSDEGRLDFILPSVPTGEAVTVTLPLRAAVGFPDENIGPLTAPVLEVHGGSGLLRGVFPPLEQWSRGAAWGASVDVAWAAPIEIDRYYTPSVIAVTSVGPADIPAGSVVSVKTDPVLAGRLNPRPASLAPRTALQVPPDMSAAAPPISETTRIADGVRVTEFRLGEPVPAGTTVTMPLITSERPVKTRVRSVSFAVVELDPPASALAMRRATGSDSSSPLASGGLPLGMRVRTGQV